MTTQEKIQFNSKCAAFLGAIPEQWYPPNKDTGRSGIHWVFPHNTWYPDNVRQHSDDLMKFHSDWNWIAHLLENIFRTKNPKSNSDTTHSTIIYDIKMNLARLNKEFLISSIGYFIDWYNQNK